MESSVFQYCKVVCLLVVLLVVLNSLCTVEATSSNSTLRAYLGDLDKELDALTCAQKKLSMAINVLSQYNITNDIVNVRRKQSQKIQTAIDQLTLEKNVIAMRCARSIGENCNEGCISGYSGLDCSLLTCFGVPSTNGSVCSGHGVCVKSDTCNCSLPYYGNNCQSANFTNLINSNSLGFKYTDGTYARSCKEYKNPSIPNAYNNEGSGMYLIKPGSTIMTVYCDMTTDGGGWTLFAAIRYDYKGVHFHVFDDNTAVASSETSSFHIKTEELMALSTQVRAVTDKGTQVVNSFYTASWPFSASCDIPSLLRSDILTSRTVSYSSLANTVYPERVANCTILSGTQVVPTHLSYCKASNGQSIGFRMGRPHEDTSIISHMSPTKSIFVTLSYYEAPEGSYAYESPGVYYNGDNNWRNGALFLR